MSVRTMAKVWEGSRHAGSDLLMLLAIADFADDAGNAYPSVATLASKCRMKPRNARYCLQSLEASGELKVALNAGPRGANRYRVMLDALGLQQLAGVQGSAGVQSSAATPATQCRKPLQPVAPKPSLNRQDPPRKERAPGKAGGQNRKPKVAGAPLAPDILASMSDVDQQILDDWIELRKSKRAPITRTVITGARAEAQKAGLTLEAFLRIWCMRGSQGLQADWLKPHELGHAEAEPAWRTEQRERTQMAAPGVAAGAMRARRLTSHSGFDQLNYSEGVTDDGRIA